MALTNFTKMNSQQKVFWSKDIWSAAREAMFFRKFLGKGHGAMIQEIKGLTKTERGEIVLMQLVADLVDDGVVGDDQREGQEEELTNYEQQIKIGLLSHQVRSRGKMAEQASVINFREQARDKLGYWLGNRIDQLCFLTLSGIGYEYKTTGGLRDKQTLVNLPFAADVLPPTANRHLMWTGTQLLPSDTTAIDSSCTASYKMIVDVIAHAKDHFVKPLKSGGKEYYVVLVRPGTLAQLKKDPDYLAAVQQLASRDGTKSPFFTGGVVTVDGAVIHEHSLVYCTKTAEVGDKWGAAGDVDGTRILVCGAQALGMANIGRPEWVEKRFDYDTQVGISVDKMFGLLKPRFHSIVDDGVEDFGCICVDLYLG